MGSRREGREMALQTLYLADTCRIAVEEALKSTLSEPGPSSVREFATHLANGVEVHKPRIDAILVKYTQNWDIKRMAVVDRNILRLSTFEILFDPETPLSVIIDEAIEVAKTYSTEDSGKFVNGILDKVKAERKPAA
ncbi:MAG: transcription antitermination factor NusB [Elusimicrobia bacterium RIFCSPLOWO2_01_FULL_60_11]|nr:MAG: transcription antitermination factor NusB [Elusimicrobia bacterium RIFCSPLOWO2_01_FULL_60_11]